MPKVICWSVGHVSRTKLKGAEEEDTDLGGDSAEDL